LRNKERSRKSSSCDVAQGLKTAWPRASKLFTIPQSQKRTPEETVQEERNSSSEAVRPGEWNAPRCGGKNARKKILKRQKQVFGKVLGNRERLGKGLAIGDWPAKELRSQSATN